MLKLKQVATVAYKYRFESRGPVNNLLLSAAKASTKVALKARGIVVFVLRETQRGDWRAACPQSLVKTFSLCARVEDYLC